FVGIFMIASDLVKTLMAGCLFAVSPTAVPTTFRSAISSWEWRRWTLMAGARNSRRPRRGFGAVVCAWRALIHTAQKTIASVNTLMMRLLQYSDQFMQQTLLVMSCSYYAVL